MMRINTYNAIHTVFCAAMTVLWAITTAAFITGALEPSKWFVTVVGVVVTMFFAGEIKKGR